MRFLKESWEVVRDEVMGTFQEFHSHGTFEKSLNASFIALIPKKGNASDIKDFRPISLVGCMRMCLFQEVPGVLCKLDIEKAYDHANWKFLLYLLRRMGNGDQWIKWIESCISSVMFSVLVNGSPADDTLVFCDADVSQLRYLRCILTCFQAVSGLKINVGKSVLVPVGEVSDISSLAAVLGCGVGVFPLLYMGLPLGSPPLEWGLGIR
ncbi:uncharacterized protein LOC132296212 [Cornus florida]|uniref:uncharacterized protein LOC132296212 n=1 Tax=Cornus florida TaxID=4283 RepID=UPI0028963574|nr:uncharacterized protein LOC132296212 [Cornus florida]